MTKRLALLMLTSFVAAGLAFSQKGQADQSWSVQAKRVSDGKTELYDYTPLPQAQQKWHLCVLIPHLKDSFWVAVAYGVAEEARRQGVKMTLLDAGGYTEINRQISQFDDCAALGADAIVIGAISEAGLTQKISEGKAKGIVQIGFVNPMFDAEVDAKQHGSSEEFGYEAGRYLVERFKDRGDPVRVIAFPGPEGSGWAEKQAEGFRAAVQGTNVEIVEEKFGDTGKTVQLSLIEDALQTYDDIDVITGNAVAAEAAGLAIDEAGRSGEILVSAWYPNQAMLDGIIAGRIAAATIEFAVLEGRIGVDLAVRVLEKADFERHVWPVTQTLSKESLDSVDLEQIFAPQDWRPITSIE